MLLQQEKILKKSINMDKETSVVLDIKLFRSMPIRNIKILIRNGWVKWQQILFLHLQEEQIGFLQM